jgi:hypothetical protein
MNLKGFIFDEMNSFVGTYVVKALYSVYTMMTYNFKDVYLSYYGLIQHNVSLFLYKHIMQITNWATDIFPSNQHQRKKKGRPMEISLKKNTF